MQRKYFFIARMLSERRPVSHAQPNDSDYSKGYEYGRAVEWDAIVEHFADEMGEFSAAEFRKACGYGENRRHV